MKLIGISGKIGTGKTTLAEHLIEKLPGNWKRIAFGDVLKQEVSDTFGVPLHWCYEHKTWYWPMNLERYELSPMYPDPPAIDMTVRDILQWWGTDVRRALVSDYWVEQMADTLVNDESREYDGIIIDDVRFPDEANLVKEFGGHLIRLNPYTMWWCDANVSGHESEVALDTYRNWNAAITPRFGKLEEVASNFVEHMGVV